MAKRKKGRLEGIDPQELGGWVMVVAGSPQADEYGVDPEPTCDNCGRPIKNVFVVPTGYKLGGDCLATLSGDDSTRQWMIGAAQKGGGAKSIHVNLVNGSVLARMPDGKRRYLYERYAFDRLVPALRKQEGKRLCEMARLIAQALGVPVTGCGSMTANMAKRKRSAARRNPGDKTVLDFLGSSLKDVYRAYDELPDEPDQFPLSRFSPVEKYEADRVKRDPQKYVFIADMLIGSDYSGGSVTRSNVEVFYREHGDKPGVYRVYGGHGTDGIALRLDVSDEGILEDLNSLEDYPVLDEDAAGQMEMDAAQESADAWAYKDFERAIERSLNITIVAGEEKLHDLFWELTREFPYHEESGGGIYFEISRMAAEVDTQLLDDIKVEYESDED